MTERGILTLSGQSVTYQALVGIRAGVGYLHLGADNIKETPSTEIFVEKIFFTKLSY